jgi:predicted MFS family arabinose efflux permease
VIAGLLIDHLGFVWAFALALLLPLLAWGLALRVPRNRPPAPDRHQARSPTAFDLLREPMLRRLLMLNVVLAAAWDAHSFVVPVVGHARGLSASSIGLVLGAFAVAATAVRLAIVSFARHLDEIKALRSAMLLAMLTMAVYVCLPGTLGLICGSALLGMALGSVQPMVLALLHQVTPDDRQGQALALRMLAINAATVTMPLGFGLLASLSVVAAPLWLMAGLLALAQWPAAALARQR